eukprot:Gb_14311 [translate_table: standard]
MPWMMWKHRCVVILEGQGACSLASISFDAMNSIVLLQVSLAMDISFEQPKSFLNYGSLLGEASNVVLYTRGRSDGWGHPEVLQHEPFQGRGPPPVTQQQQQSSSSPPYGWVAADLYQKLENASKIKQEMIAIMRNLSKWRDPVPQASSDHDSAPTP